MTMGVEEVTITCDEACLEGEPFLREWCDVQQLPQRQIKGVVVWERRVEHGGVV